MNDGLQNPARLQHSADRAFADANCRCAQGFEAALPTLLAQEYGFAVRAVSPAARGFYGETWTVQTERDAYFLKADFWPHHQERYRKSLSAVQYLTDHGLSFVPRVIPTARGTLHFRIQTGVAALFTRVPGALMEDCPVETLYGLLAQVYRLPTDGLYLEAETFGAELADDFFRLARAPSLSDEVRRMLAQKAPAIEHYAARLRQFSIACRGDRRGFHLTHGDAGGNCMADGDALFLVDWDSALLAPVERDAWPLLSDPQSLDQARAVLAQNGLDDRLEPRRMGYYCYQFYFYYLNEYLQAILSARDEARRQALARDLIGYLTESWIDQRLNFADALAPA